MKIITSKAILLAACLSMSLVSSFVFAAPTTLLYVSNPFPNSLDLQGQGKVTVFDPNANGPTAPLRTINQPAGAWTLTLDSASRIYSQYFLYDNPTYVYSPNANGNDAPILIALGGFNSQGTGIADATGVAVDSRGYMYKVAGANSGFGSYLEAYAPNATSPFLMLQLNNHENFLTVDGNDNVIISSLNSLKVFAPKLAGGTPIRTITGPHTGFDTAPPGKLSYSKFSNRIYVVSYDSTSHLPQISVFDSAASGDAAPLRIITGPATGMKSIIQGLAGNPVTGEIFVLSSDPADQIKVFGPGVITVYPQLANGNIPPLRTITDSVSQFISSQSIAFSPPLSPILSINTGGATSGNFVADNSFSGGAPVTWSNPINTSLLSGVVPPQNVLQSDREGNFTYTIHGLVAYASYSATLYFAENYFTAPNKRVFNVTINGTPSLENFDVYAAAGARYKAIQRTFTTTATANGEIVLKFDASIDQAKVGAMTLQLLQ